MSKIRSIFQFSNLETLDSLTQHLNIFTDDLISNVNGNLEFGENIKTSLVTINFTAANTEVAVTHTLGRVPIGYMQVGANAAASLYAGTSANTDGIIYLKSSAIAIVNALVF